MRLIGATTAFISPSLPLAAQRACRLYCPNNGNSAHRLSSHHVTIRRARMCASRIEGEDEDKQEPHPLDMDMLKQRMAELKAKNESTSNMPGKAVIDLSTVIAETAEATAEDEHFVDDFEKLSTLWVIIFTNVVDGSDGVYSLTVAEDNIVLAFEKKDEAKRYALCLEAQEFPRPQICELNSAELRSFCSEAGFRLGFVPKGAIITPPDESAIDDIDKWRGKPNSKRATKDSTGLSEEDLDIMRKRLDSLFGQ